MIGTSQIRKDAYDKVTGKGMYTADFFQRYPGMLHVKVLRSPYAHARIRRIDVSRAEEMDGVVAIVTGENSRDIPWHMFPKQSAIAVDEAIWAGQTVAIVAAETLEEANEAIEAIEVDYEPLPFVVDPMEAIKPDPVSVVDPLFGKRPGDRPVAYESPNIVGKFDIHKGNSEEAFAQADVIVEGGFLIGKKSHHSLEPAVCIVEYNSDGGITVISNGCGVHAVIKRLICTCLGLPETLVRCIQPCQGGSFGGRLQAYIEATTVAIAIKAKRTVGYVFTRKEMSVAAPSNWPASTRVKLGATKDGRIIAEKVELIEEVGAMLNNKGFNGLISGSGCVSVYDVENVDVLSAGLVTNTVPAGAYRGLGCPESEFGVECLINELADKLHMSPVEIRLKNFIQKGGKNAYGQVVTSIGVAKCLKAVAEAINFDEPCKQDGSEWKYGKGIAAGGKQNTPLGRSEAEVRYYSDGSLELRISCDENGMGATTALPQMVADRFQVPFESVKVVKADTDKTPFDNYSASSRTIYNTGNAVLLACDDAIDQLKEAAARELGLAKSKVEIANGKAFFKGGLMEEIPLTKLFKPFSYTSQQNWGLFQGTPVIGRGRFAPSSVIMPDANGQTERFWNWYQFAAAAVEIAVNERTGQIKILRVANAADTGNPINPKLIEGQIEGGTAMAIGFVLNEEHIYNERGEIANTSLGDYRLPTILDIPARGDMFSLIAPDPLPDGPYGAKGMSESVMIPIGPAIAEALYQAVGVRVHGYPLTAERVLALIEEKKANEVGGTI